MGKKPKNIQQKTRKPPKRKSTSSSSDFDDKGIEEATTSCSKGKRMDSSSDSDLVMLSEHEDINGLLDDEAVTMGDFVLVKLTTKKKIIHYVGHVEKLLHDSSGQIFAF